jgi:hypothetical protein
MLQPGSSLAVCLVLSCALVLPACMHGLLALALSCAGCAFAVASEALERAETCCGRVGAVVGAVLVHGIPLPSLMAARGPRCAFATRSSALFTFTRTRHDTHKRARNAKVYGVGAGGRAASASKSVERRRRRTSAHMQPCTGTLPEPTRRQAKQPTSAVSGEGGATSPLYAARAESPPIHCALLGGLQTSCL